MSKEKKVAIIGSGAGGLAAAAYLSTFGYRVTVLEQADNLGGYLNPFKRKGYCFDPGVHYVGELRPGQSFHRVLSGLDLNVEDLFCEMDPEGFDRFLFPEADISQPRDLERYRQRLYETFPRDIAGIDRYFNALHTLRQAMTLMNKLQGGHFGLGSVLPMLKTLPALRWLRSTFADFLEYVTDNKTLRAVLGANCGDYGLPPSMASALYGILITAHYGDGAFFPRGGSGRLRDALVDKAKAHGAEFFTRTPVERIVLKNGRVAGVECADGRFVEADCVVSNAEPAVTFKVLLAPNEVPAKLSRKVKQLKPSLATFSVFLGVKRDLRNHGLTAGNVWAYPNTDIEGMYAAFLRGDMPSKPTIFFSPNSLKDDSGQMAPEGHSTLELVTMAPYELFAKWDGMKSYQRGKDYEEVKQRVMDNVLEAADSYLPGVIGDVEVKEAGSAVTNSYYVRSVRGGAYGPAVTPDQVGPWRFLPKTAIPGLYLAGSGVMGGGVSPCLTSGVLAAKILRKMEH